MVQVPQRPLSTVEPTPARLPYQRLSTTPAEFGGAAAQETEALGKGLEKAASAGLAIVAQRQHDDNIRELKKAEIEYTSRLRGIGYGDGSAQNPGYYGSHGEDAITRSPDARAAVEQARTEIRDGIQNDRVRTLFDEVSRTHAERELDKMSVWLDHQRGVANISTSKARIQNARTSALRPCSSTNPTRGTTRFNSPTRGWIAPSTELH